MIEFLFVGLGGFIGCSVRFGLTKLIPITNIPLTTLISNVIAGFMVGAYFAVEKELNFSSPKLKLFLTTGMMGGLSTFSTFSIETVNLFSGGKYTFALLNVLLNVSLSLIGVLMGIWTVKLIIKR